MFLDRAVTSTGGFSRTVRATISIPDNPDA